jgi:hypothetical protein
MRVPTHPLPANIGPSNIHVGEREAIAIALPKPASFCWMIGQPVD